VCFVLQNYELLILLLLHVVGPKHYWTSGNDFATEGQYYWDSTGKPILYFDWDIFEPNNALEEDNIMLRWENNAYHWNDIDVNGDRGPYVIYAMCEEEV
jgi:hypothetical protein